MMDALAARYRQAESMLALLGLRRVEERVRGFLGFWRRITDSPAMTA